MPQHNKADLFCFWAYVSCQETHAQRLTTKRAEASALLLKAENGCDTSQSRVSRVWAYTSVKLERQVCVKKMVGDARSSVLFVMDTCPKTKDGHLSMNTLVFSKATVLITDFTRDPVRHSTTSRNHCNTNKIAKENPFVFSSVHTMWPTFPISFLSDYNCERNSRQTEDLPASR